MNKVAYAQNRSKGVFSSSLDGVLVYMGGTRQGRLLSWVDRRQNAFMTAGNVSIDNAAFLTADDSRILYDTYDPVAKNFDIWMLDIGRGLKSRITFDPSDDSNPVSAPDGTRFVFTSWKEGVNLLTRSAAGTDDAVLLQRSITSALATDWSSDGRYVLFQDVEETASWDIWYMDVTGDSTKTPFVRTEFTEENARFSPDAKWVAYSSDESARNEVYLRPFPTGHGKWQVSAAGGSNPVWDGRGRAIYYNADQGIMETAVMISGGVPSIGESRVVFRNPSDAGLRLHGVTADGNRLLVSHLPTSQSTVSLSVVTNWRRVAEAR
jgi:Tol biopolymer transport system component